MRKALLLLGALFLLAGCTLTQAQPGTKAVRWETFMNNPLYAERYWDELTERMVDMVLEEKDTLDQREMAVVDEVRRYAVQQAQRESAKKREGRLGSFTTLRETTEGYVLLRGRTLFLAPNFVTYPGPNLRIMLTTMLDPREGTFPDKTSVDLGRLESPYGAQEYTLPGNASTEGLRTVVLYDKKLDRMYAFAQLQ